MKKLLAFLLVVMIALNVAVLLQKSNAKEESGKALAFKLPRINPSDMKPGILPGLVSF